jgi:hypothetical protein
MVQISMRIRDLLNLIHFFAIGLLMAGCVSNPPLPSTTEYVTTTGGQFLIDTEKGTIKYGMNYHLTKELGNSANFTAVFENPEPGGENLIVNGNIQPGQNDLIIQSPVLSGIENNREYNVLLKLFSNGDFISEHNQKVQFSLPQHILEQTNLTIY